MRTKKYGRWREVVKVFWVVCREICAEMQCAVVQKEKRERCDVQSGAGSKVQPQGAGYTQWRAAMQ